MKHCVDEKQKKKMKKSSCFYMAGMTIAFTKIVPVETLRNVDLLCHFLYVTIFFVPLNSWDIAHISFSSSYLKLSYCSKPCYAI